MQKKKKTSLEELVLHSHYFIKVINLKNEQVHFSHLQSYKVEDQFEHFREIQR